MLSDLQAWFSFGLELLCARSPFINRLYSFPRLTLGLTWLNGGSVLRDLGHQAILDAFSKDPQVRQASPGFDNQGAEYLRDAEEGYSVASDTHSVDRPGSRDSYISMISYPRKVEEGHTSREDENKQDQAVTRGHAAHRGSPEAHDQGLLRRIQPNNIPPHRDASDTETEGDHGIGEDQIPGAISYENSGDAASTRRIPVTRQPGIQQPHIRQPHIPQPVIETFEREIVFVGDTRILNSALDDSFENERGPTSLRSRPGKRGPYEQSTSSSFFDTSPSPCDVPMDQRLIRRDAEFERIEVPQPDVPIQDPPCNSPNNQESTKRNKGIGRAFDQHGAHSSQGTINIADQATTILGAVAPKNPISKQNEAAKEKTKCNKRKHDWLTNPVPLPRRENRSPPDINRRSRRRFRLYQCSPKGNTVTQPSDTTVSTPQNTDRSSEVYRLSNARIDRLVLSYEVPTRNSRGGEFPPPSSSQ